jgi:hypothetical protein
MAFTIGSNRSSLADPLKLSGLKKQMRNERKKNIAMTGRLDADRDKILARAEWLGRESEEEIERVRRDESRQYQND